MNALILVCALTVAAPDCQKNTAIHNFYDPEAQQSMVGCLNHGMLYASQSGLIEPGTYPKVVCRQSGRVVAAAQ